MKKFKLLFLLPLLLLAGCNTSGYKEKENEFLGSENMQVICKHVAQKTAAYIRDNDTNIMYICTSAVNNGGISVYYNSKGEPMTYSEFKKVHIEKYHK